MGYIHIAAAIAAASAAAGSRKEKSMESSEQHGPIKVSVTTRPTAVRRRRWVVYDRRTGKRLASARWRWVANVMAWLECLGCERWCEVTDEDTYDCFIANIPDEDFDPPVRR